MGAPEKRRQKRIREYVINRDGSICCYCDDILTPETITMEHIVPDSKRGTFNTTNLTVSCAECNNKRGNKPFFAYCKKMNFSEEKIVKYRRLYFSNLKIKVLNIAKEECLSSKGAIPNLLIKQACQILDINHLNFSDYEDIYFFSIKFDQLNESRRIRFCFDQLIRIIEAEAADI
jgi:hypothetical protein